MNIPAVKLEDLEGGFRRSKDLTPNTGKETFCAFAVALGSTCLGRRSVNRARAPVFTNSVVLVLTDSVIFQDLNMLVARNSEGSDSAKSPCWHLDSYPVLRKSYENPTKICHARSLESKPQSAGRLRFNHRTRHSHVQGKSEITLSLFCFLR